MSVKYKAGTLFLSYIHCIIKYASFFYRYDFT